MQLASLPVTFTGSLVIPDPTATANMNLSASTLICGHIIAAIKGTAIYRFVGHLSMLKAGIAELHKWSLVRYKDEMGTILTSTSAGESRTI
jgi:hypothetical protein